VEQQLSAIGALGGSASTNGMYFPAGANGNEFALIKGRPLIISEISPALGTPGDLVLADLSQYIIIDGGLQSALSLECQWLSFQGVFRFVLRVDGKPAWSTPITSYNGTGQRSPFVALAQR
jgi:HK97 family phage major capsid protein